MGGGGVRRPEDKKCYNNNMQITNALEFEDKDLPVHYQGSFGRFDKGREAVFKILVNNYSITLEFFISFLDSITESEIKIDEKKLLDQAKEITQEISIEKDLEKLPNKMFFLYSKSRGEFDLLN